MIKDKKTIKLSVNDMEGYFQSYDIIKRKYFWDTVRPISTALIDEVLSLEKNFKEVDGRWTSEKAQDAYLMVKHVYDDEEMGIYMGLLQMVQEKFIGDFVGIQGIERLFRSSYFNFEWMMHLEYNQSKKDYTYYRDHYIHQIKNMYEMLVLLDECGFMQYCIDSYKENTNFIADYIRDGIERQTKNNGEKEKRLFKHAQREGFFKDKEPDEILQEYYYRHLIHSVAVIAALTHDIGYPIAYVLRTTGNLHQFLALSDAFVQINDAMPHLNEILQDSLLYQTVDPKEIAKRVNDQYDHGTFSALILLSQYYETGAIYSLEPFERTAIELSAVVIYNHTLKYEYMTGKKEKKYHNVFCENPISYLFRLCDDMQEWGRIYFHISKKSNFLVCQKCHMPVTRVPKFDDEDKKRNKDIVDYSCGCGAFGKRRTKFKYRKLTNIQACESLTIREIPSVGTPSGGQTDTRTVLGIDYHLDALLQLSYYNPQFAKQRADSVYEIKRMLDRQSRIPGIYVDTFLTNNPITIKVECLERYLRREKKRIWKTQNFIQSGVKHNENRVVENLRKLIADFDKKATKLNLSDVLVRLKELDIKLQGNNAVRNKIRTSILTKWQDSLDFYSCLSVLGTNLEKLRQEGYFRERDSTVEAASHLADKVASCYKINSRPTTALIMDYLWYRIRNVSEEEFFAADRPKYITDYYYEACLSNQYIINVVTDYVGSDDYDKAKESLHNGKGMGTNNFYDLYTDYELYAAMGKEE